MKNIQVVILNESHECPAGMMMFLAKLTQRGHTISNMQDLNELYEASMGSHKMAKEVANLPHGTIKRFAPITIAIVGASRRFLAQARTHHVGIDFVSASLQYSDYSNTAQFVVPYEIIENDYGIGDTFNTDKFLNKCEGDIEFYRHLVDIGFDNDTAGYGMNQALRNVLIVQGNHDAWDNFIRLRSCHRNTPETQYVALKIWETLLTTQDGKELFAYAGPFCAHGKCREGKMSCGDPFVNKFPLESLPGQIIEKKFPLLLERP